jgi:hypothetical protein
MRSSKQARAENPGCDSSNEPIQGRGEELAGIGARQKEDDAPGIIDAKKGQLE